MKVNETIEEIELDYIKELENVLISDFSIDYLDETMLVYPLNSVLAFIEEAAEECVASITRIRNGIVVINPEEFYVEI